MLHPLDMTDALPLPPSATTAWPGTERKIQVLCDRLAAGYHPHHPGDVRIRRHGDPLLTITARRPSPHVGRPQQRQAPAATPRRRRPPRRRSDRFRVDDVVAIGRLVQRLGLQQLLAVLRRVRK